MAPNFSKNAILEGYIDFFCLICETYLRNEDETIKHISKKSHQSNLNESSYVKDFKDDCIKKINSKYFCELCNKLLPVMAKFRIHISDPLHLDMKKGNIFRYRNNNVIAFDKVVIDEESWHGLCEDSCAVCNLEYDNKSKHKADVSHIIKLIQIKVVFYEDKYIYRKIDETTFQCLTCNKVAALDNLTTHFEEIEHKNKYQECCDEFQKSLQICSDKPSLDTNSDLQGSSDEIKGDNEGKDIININTEKKARTSDLITKEMDEPEIMKNAEDRNKTDLKYILDEKRENEICKVLNTTDYITLDENGNIWCILCNWCMNQDKIMVHCKGKHHQTILKLHRERIEKYKNINKVLKTPENTVTKTVENNSNLLNFVDQFQKNGITMNFESKTATCRKCSPANTLEFNYNDITNHIKEHTNISKKTTKTLPFPSGNLKVGENNNMLFTSPVVKRNQGNKEETNCDNNFTEDCKQDTRENETNINDNSEKTTNTSKECSNNVTKELSKDVKIGKKPKTNVQKSLHLKKVFFDVFVDDITEVKTGIFNDIIINDKFVVSGPSFLCLTTKNHTIECVACNEIIFNLEEHVKSLLHNKTLNEMFIIVEMDAEFIRELPNNHFHCGFCNSVKICWEDMQAHVKTFSHKEAKNSAEWRLSQYKADGVI